MSWGSEWIVLVEEHFSRQENGCVYGNLGNLRVEEGELMCSVPNGLRQQPWTKIFSTVSGM